MNRSFQAVSILIISLAGALVSVTWSSTPLQIPSVQGATASNSKPQAHSGPATSSAEPVKVALRYEEGCGHDQSTGQVYTAPVPTAPVTEVANAPVKTPVTVPTDLDAKWHQLVAAGNFVASPEFATQFSGFVSHWSHLANRPELPGSEQVDRWLEDFDFAPPAAVATSAPSATQRNLAAATATTLDALANYLHARADDLHRTAQQNVAKSNTAAILPGPTR